MEVIEAHGLKVVEFLTKKFPKNTVTALISLNESGTKFHYRLDDGPERLITLDYRFMYAMAEENSLVTN